MARCNLVGPCQVRPGLSIELQTPVDLDAQWVRWLGELNADRLRNANFFIVATAHSQSPGIFDDENTALDEFVHRFYLALSLQGVFAASGILFVAGANEGSEVSIRQASRITSQFYHFEHAGPATVDDATIRVADQIELRMNTLFTEPYSVPTTLRYRLFLGLLALRRGLRDRLLPARLHQFARSVEAIIQPRIAKTKRDFQHRLKSLVSAAHAQEVFEEIYDLRSAYEHLHMKYPDSFTSLKTEDERKKRAALRAYQAELVACNVYCHILTNGSLFNGVFADDTTLNAFWTPQSDPTRRTTWGSVFNLDAAISPDVISSL